MALADRSKRFALKDEPQSAERPEIWVEGRQRPRFKFGAFAIVTWGMAKRGLLPEMVEAEGRLWRFGLEVRNGDHRPRLDWAGRYGRAFPSHVRVGDWILGLSDLFAGARARLVGGDGAEEAPLAYPHLIRDRGGAPAPISALRPREPAPKVATERTLHAIRAAIGPVGSGGGYESAAREVEAGQAGGGAKLFLAGPRRWLGQKVWQVMGIGLLGVLMAFALPVGAVRALLYHLDGGDLADWS